MLFPLLPPSTKLSSFVGAVLSHRIALQTSSSVHKFYVVQTWGNGESPSWTSSQSLKDSWQIHLIKLLEWESNNWLEVCSLLDTSRGSRSTRSRVNHRHRKGQSHHWGHHRTSCRGSHTRCGLSGTSNATKIKIGVSQSLNEISQFKLLKQEKRLKVLNNATRGNASFACWKRLKALNNEK